MNSPVIDDNDYQQVKRAATEPSLKRVSVLPLSCCRSRRSRRGPLCSLRFVTGETRIGLAAAVAEGPAERRQHRSGSTGPEQDNTVLRISRRRHFFSCPLDLSFASSQVESHHPVLNQNNVADFFPTLGLW